MTEVTPDSDPAYCLGVLNGATAVMTFLRVRFVAGRSLEEAIAEAKQQEGAAGLDPVFRLTDNLLHVIRSNMVHEIAQTSCETTQQPPTGGG